jgi:hypothetical protein
MRFRRGDSFGEFMRSRLPIIPRFKPTYGFQHDPEMSEFSDERSISYIFLVCGLPVLVYGQVHSPMVCRYSNDTKTVLQIASCRLLSKGIAPTLYKLSQEDSKVYYSYMRRRTVLFTVEYREPTSSFLRFRSPSCKATGSPAIEGQGLY